MAVAVDFALVLDRLFPGENPHPMACSPGVTYADLANEKWRGSRPIPSEVELQAAWDQIQAEQPELFNPVLAQKKDAKAALTKTDAAAIRSRSSSRLQLKTLRAFCNALLGRLVTNGTITQQQADNIKSQIPAWAVFQAQLSAEIDADVANG